MIDGINSVFRGNSKSHLQMAKATFKRPATSKVLIGQTFAAAGKVANGNGGVELCHFIVYISYSCFFKAQW